MTNQTSINGIQHPKPHFVLVPLMAQGHMIPMADMACLLADRGAAVSYITTPVNASRITPLIDRVKASGISIRFVELPIPAADAGLPDGCENADLIPSEDMIKPFFYSLSLLGEPLEIYLRQQLPGPTCMISDSCQPWTAELARKLSIPRFVFHGPSCFYILCVHNIRKNGIYDRVIDQFEPFVVPDLPHHSVVVSAAQSPVLLDIPGWEKLRDEAQEAEATADGVVVNSFDELEPWFMESYRNAIGKKVWAIGPLCLHNKDNGYKSTRGNKAAVDHQRVLGWLDSIGAAGPVIYVSFGSIVRNSPSQLIEIGLGLEASSWPFIWVIKDAERSPEVEKWLSEGFEERTRDRGLVIKGWAPQVMILSHPSVGGFLTHCGWNSALEAVAAGVPVITWPYFADQFLNEKLMVEVLEIGVSIGVKVPCDPLKDNKEVMVKRDDVEKAVVSLMDGGEEGKRRRERAKELGVMAKEAMEEGGSSYQNLSHLIQYALEHQHK